MKKIVLAIFVILTFKANASHLMGGQITSRNIGGLSYEVTLSLYRDTLGIPMNVDSKITYQNSIGNYNVFHMVNYSYMFQLGNGVEKYIFLDTITFPNNGVYNVYSENCCRNAAILNIPFAGAEGMRLNAIIKADPTNSSPNFLNEPITLAQLNQPFSYNPLPYDLDGDSLSWVLDKPLNDSPGVPISNYVLPYADSLGPFQMDSLTGEITFIPNTIGYFQVSVKAIEWRNGIQIGFIRRDMQIIVIPSSNLPVQIQVNSSIHISTTNSIYLNSGDSLLLNITAVNPDNGITSIGFAGSLFLSSNPAYLLSNTPIQNGFNSIISWIPTIDDVQEQPYYLSFRIGDYSPLGVFFNDYTYRVFVVNNTTGLGENFPVRERYFIKSINMLGQEIDPESYGFRIDLYSDGTAKKIYRGQ